MTFPPPEASVSSKPKLLITVATRPLWSSLPARQELVLALRRARLLVHGWVSRRRRVLLAGARGAALVQAVHGERPWRVRRRRYVVLLPRLRLRRRLLRAAAHQAAPRRL